jgi:hypothetical protein
MVVLHRLVFLLPPEIQVELQGGELEEYLDQQALLAAKVAQVVRQIMSMLLIVVGGCQHQLLAAVVIRP